MRNSWSSIALGFVVLLSCLYEGAETYELKGTGLHLSSFTTLMPRSTKCAGTKRALGTTSVYVDFNAAPFHFRQDGFYFPSFSVFSIFNGIPCTAGQNMFIFFELKTYEAGSPSDLTLIGQYSPVHFNRQLKNAQFLKDFGLQDVKIAAYMKTATITKKTMFRVSATLKNAKSRSVGDRLSLYLGGSYFQLPNKQFLHSSTQQIPYYGGEVSFIGRKLETSNHYAYRQIDIENVAGSYSGFLKLSASGNFERVSTADLGTHVIASYALGGTRFVSCLTDPSHDFCLVDYIIRAHK